VRAHIIKFTYVWKCVFFDLEAHLIWLANLARDEFGVLDLAEPACGTIFTSHSITCLLIDASLSCHCYTLPWWHYEANYVSNSKYAWFDTVNHFTGQKNPVVLYMQNELTEQWKFFREIRSLENEVSDQCVPEHSIWKCFISPLFCPFSSALLISSPTAQ
jgi:hypothetical protein